MVKFWEAENRLVLPELKGEQNGELLISGYTASVTQDE